MALGVPIANNYHYISIRRTKGNRDNITVRNNKRTKTTSCPLHVDGRSIEKATNLILYLKLVSEVPSTCRDGAICTKNTILPGSASHLNSRPATIQRKIKNWRREHLISHNWNLPSDKKFFIQFVLHIHHNIIISCNIKDGTWKFPIHSYNLQLHNISWHINQHWKSGAEYQFIIT